VTSLGPVAGGVPLMPSHRLWLERGFQPGYPLVSWQVLETIPGLDPATLEEAVRAVLLHHEGLRLRLLPDSSGWRVSEAADQVDPLVSRVDVPPEAEDELAARLQEEARSMRAGIDLERGPLVRVRHLDLGSRRGRLLLVVHHFVNDALSTQILLKDLSAAYERALAGLEVVLPRQTTSYPRYAELLHDHVAQARSRAGDRVLAATGGRGRPVAGGDAVDGRQLRQARRRRRRDAGP